MPSLTFLFFPRGMSRENAGRCRLPASSEQLDKVLHHAAKYPKIVAVMSYVLALSSAILLFTPAYLRLPIGMPEMPQIITAWLWVVFVPSALYSAVSPILWLLELWDRRTILRRIDLPELRYFENCHLRAGEFYRSDTCYQPDSQRVQSLLHRGILVKTADVENEGGPKGFCVSIQDPYFEILRDHFEKRERKKAPSYCHRT